MILGCRRILIAALGVLADFEFRFRGHARNPRIRMLQWRLLRIESRLPISIGHEIYIRNEGNLRIGSRCAIGSFCKIWNYCPVTIGDDFLSAGLLTMNTGGHDIETLQPQTKEIRIGNRVWVGLNVTILAGVTIGDDAVIAAGSLVCDDVPAKCLVMGIPAKPRRFLSRSDKADLWSWTQEIKR